MRNTILFAAMAAFVCASPARAQETPRFGIVMGYPAAVGVLWTVSERVAVRPEVSISRTSSESTTTLVGLPTLPGFVTSSTTSSSGWQLGAGVSALLYLTKGDALRTYVSPRYTYARSSTTIEGRLGSPIVPMPAGPATTVTTSHSTSGAFGGQYTLGKRFGLFGELGLNYQHSGETPSLGSSPFVTNDFKGWSLSLRSGVGVILYFGS
jgi:hypothetical protein